MARVSRFFAAVMAAAFALSADGATKKKTTSKSKSDVAPAAKSALPFQIGTVPKGAPNVLFIIADDLNDWIGWMGGHPQARTPNMDRLAKMGMRFTNAHCNYALCNPSRTSLLTGMLPSTSGVFGNEQDWRLSKQIAGKLTLPEHFRANGFTTAAGGKIFHANHGGPEGRLSGWHGGRRGFECDTAWTVRFPAPGVQIPDLPVHTGRNFNGMDIWHWDWGGIEVADAQTDDGQVVSWAAQFLAQQQAKPFFLAVGLYRPHSPWYAPQKYFDERPLDQVILPEVKADDLDDVPEIAKSHLKGDSHHKQIVAKNLWKEAVRAYLANITFCDAMLGQVIDALNAGPNAKNTIVVFTSDHGWYLGEKQMWHKGKLWEETTRIPLTILAPGVTNEDSVSNQPVSLIDLYPTLCDLARVKAPAHLDGETLAPILKDPAVVRERPVVSMSGGGKSAAHAARSDRWRYIRYNDGSEELYDHSVDANEWTNLAAKSEHDALKKSLAEWFPKQSNAAARTIAEIAPTESSEGSSFYVLQNGDEIGGDDAPRIAGRGIHIDLAVDFFPPVDQDSTLVSQGDETNGWALHFVAGKPTLTVLLDGRKTSLTTGGIPPGRALIRAVIGTDGTLSLAVHGVSETSSAAPFPAAFPVQPKGALRVGQSFGILDAKEFPNSTPFDGTIHRLRLTVFPAQQPSPALIPSAGSVEIIAPAAKP